MPNFTSAPQNTNFLLTLHGIQGGTYSPATTATQGRAGSLFIQFKPASGPGPFAVWQKQDDGLTTNWSLFGGGGGGSQTTFVYRPGGVAGGNVYTSWAALYAALNAVDGPCVVQLDNSAGAVLIPAGTYDLLDVKLIGLGGKLLTQANLAEGVIFQNLAYIGGSLNLISNANVTSAMTISALGQLLVVDDISSFGSIGTAPFIHVGAGGGLNVIAKTNSDVYLNSISVDAGRSVNIWLYNLSILSPTALSGLGTVSVFYDASSSVAAQGGFGGTLNLLLVDLAEQVKYAPATPANWVALGGSPTQTASALDKLAAGIAAIPSAAIPTRETFALTAPDIANGYLTLANLAIDATVNPIVQGAGPLIGGSIAAGDDYEMTVVLGVTRVTFSPGVVAAWFVSQRVQIQYSHN